ncbi:response regulator [Paenibacillus hodogayensis]|uniref:Response regulator n=1 Tax=Paenibacillus hodogayensis TaxID=279208 RepID=A0ABV5VZ56_9BACL
MKAILIDDEKPALLQLERLLSADGRIRVDGAYTNARAGLEHLRADEADVDLVFLDIDMPGMNGLQAAEYIAEINREIRIVFTTAYSEYAIEAFELNAIDYVLKPIQPARLAKTIERFQPIGSSLPRKDRPQQPDTPNVFAFRRLGLADGGDSGRKVKWRTLKAQELFAYMMHQKGQWVDKDHLLHTLWPDMEASKGITHLHTTIYQVRKVLKDWGGPAAIEYSHESYRLSGEYILTDVELFERKLASVDDISFSNYNRCESAVSLYRGDYLEEHDYIWAQPKKLELQHRYAAIVMGMAEFDMNAGHEREALNKLRGLQEKEPYMEELYRLMMSIYARLEDYGALRSCYENFTHLLRTELGGEPDEKTKRLVEKLLSSRG